MITYGSHVNYLVLQVLQKQTSPLSVKEIAQVLKVYPSAREQRNCEMRIRRAVNDLLNAGEVMKEEFPSLKAHVVCSKYFTSKHKNQDDVEGQRIS